MYSLHHIRSSCVFILANGAPKALRTLFRTVDTVASKMMERRASVFRASQETSDAKCREILFSEIFSVKRVVFSATTKTMRNYDVYEITILGQCNETRILFKSVSGRYYTSRVLNY